MDATINSAIQKALELLKAGNKTGAYSILVSVLEQNADVAEAWYLLAFTLSDSDQKLDSFRQVLRIDPNNQAAQKQLEKLTAPPLHPQVDAFHESPIPTPEPPAPTIPAPAKAVPTFAQTQMPRPSQATTPKKKESTRQRLMPWIWTGIAVTIALVIIGLPILYITNGMETNRQVDALFAERKCTEVVAHKTFAQTFPKALFSSLYSVYHQIDECQAKLDLDYFLGTQHWPSAYDVIQHYLGNYPNGVFSAEMSEKAGSVLTAWANNLAAEKDYKTAIERLELIEGVYSSSSAASASRNIIFNDYLFWGRDLFEQKDFEGAEKVLKEVSLSEKASAEQVKQANQGIAAVYLQWGKKEIENGNTDQGLQHYDAAQSLAPDLADYTKLKNQAGLIRVEALIQKNDFDQAITILNAQLETVTEEQDKADILAEQTKVFNLYGQSDGKQAQALMSATSISMCGGQPATIPIFGTDPNVSRFAFVSPFTMQIPDGWGAFRPAEMHYSVCIESTKAKIQTCGPYYSGGYASAVIYRTRFSWTVKLYDLTTGKLYKTTKFQGPSPRACRAREAFYSGTSTEIAGAMPGIQPVLDWLTKLKVHH
jgi:tetratricopeptide (TPR) repeat protein